MLLDDEPAEKCNGLLNRTESVQHNYGVSGQVTWRNWLARGNALTAGAGYDGSRSAFQQSTQLGYLNPDRSVTPLDAFADGVTGGTVDGEPYDNRVDLDGHGNTASIFASDVLPIGNAWNVTMSARYNRTSVSNADQLNPGGGPGSLDGDHVFSRLNPAAGVTFSPSPSLNTYAGYSEGSRAPTSIELGCADPNEPCKLPNALAGDPPLKQVVTRTLEAGIRGKRGAIGWTAGAFYAANQDDILFVASTQTGFGYFKNFGSTRRQGIELGISGRRGRVTGGRELHLSQCDVRESGDRRRDGQQHERHGGRGRQGTRRHNRDRAGRSHPAHSAPDVQGILRRPNQRPGCPSTSIWSPRQGCSRAETRTT